MKSTIELHLCESCEMPVVEGQYSCKWCGKKTPQEPDYDAEAKDREIDHENTERE